MKKIFITLFICLFTANANAGIWTYAQATSAKSAARRAENAIEETQKEVIDLKKEVEELREKVDKLIKLMEKQNEKEKDDNNSKDS